MARKHKADRRQYGLFATPLDALIDDDNPVRVIDAFVDFLDLEALGFHRVQNSGQGAASYQLYRSSYTVCADCPFKTQCLSRANIRQRHGRTIERSEYEQSVQQNRERILLHRDKYKRRQAIVEHPFGTIKRSWGGYYTLLKSKEKVSGEMAMLFTCYNLRRALTIFGIEGLLEALKSGKVVIFGLWPAVVSVCVPRICPPVWCLWLRADFQPRFSALCA